MPVGLPPHVNAAAEYRRRRRNRLLRSEIRSWFLTLSTIAFFGVISWLGYSVVRDEHQTTAALRESSKSITDNANKQVTQIGQDVHRALVEADLTAMEARKASAEQRAFWDARVPVIANKAESTLDRTNELLSSLRNTSDGLNQDGQQITASVTSTTEELKPAFNNAATALTAFTGVASAATKDLSDPHLTNLFESLDQSGKQFVGIATDIHHTTTSLDQEVTKLTHPTKWGRFEALTGFGFDLARDIVQIKYDLAPTTFKLFTSAAPSHQQQPDIKSGEQTK